MIILSVGMPRAGSGWYYNLTNDLMIASGAQDVRQIRQRFRLQGILTEINCNIGVLSPRRLLLVMIPSLMGNTFVIKAHAAPTPLALSLIRWNLIRPTYIYRDPRDALLSAFENGQRARQRNRDNAFSHLVDFETALRFMQEYAYISEAWFACDLALHARYEDLLTDYVPEVKKLVDFLELDPENEALSSVIDKYRPDKPSPDQKGLHFGHGKIGRFRQKMTQDQQEAMQKAFEPYLISRGYAI